MMKRVLLGLAVLTLAGRAGAAEIRTISDRFEEDVVGITLEGGRALLKTSRRQIRLEEVKHIRFDERIPASSADANVILLNKDEIHGAIAAGDAGGDWFKLRTGSLGEVQVTLGAVGALFVNMASDQERTFMQKHLGWLGKKGLEGRPTEDAVFIRTGGKASGTIQRVTQDGVVLQAEGLGDQTFLLKDVHAVVMGSADKPPAEPAGTLVRVRCADGSVISGAVLGLAGGTLRIQHVLGVLAVDVKNILELFVLNGAFVYLSDLEPTAVDEKFPEGFEYAKHIWSWKRDQEVRKGGRLRLGGRIYDKGLGVHTYCSLTFNIAGGFREFRAVIGLDDSTKYLGEPKNSAVRFRVLVDGKPAKELAEGKKKQRGEPPDEISINIEGAKQLTLIADYGDFLHILGRADWADAHLVK